MKKQLLTLLTLLSLMTNSLFAQTQIGLDVKGDGNYDKFGYSVSMPDPFTLAAGSHHNGKGYVKVYRWSGNSWAQKGNDVIRTLSTDKTGYSISMPDSNTIAVGSPENGGISAGSGLVRIFRWNGTFWVQKGLGIDGKSTGRLSGRAVSMPDSNTVVIGSDGGTLAGSGFVRIFKWNGSVWIQKGMDIIGKKIIDNSGFSVSMPDSNTVAIGSPHNYPDSVGITRIYVWDGVAWIQKGFDIRGEDLWGLSGTSVSMPDSNTVAIGAPQNNGNGNRAGNARIYTWTGSAWIQKGADIDGEAAGDRSGTSVSMPDSNTIAIGAYANDGTASNAGHVRVYRWNGTTWAQDGVDIDGGAADDWFGYAVSMGGANTLAVGSHLYSAQDSGKVQVYQFCNFIPDTLSPIVCDTFISPSGKYIWRTSGKFRDTIYNPIGCNTHYLVDLRVNRNSKVLVSTVCDSLLSPSGKYIWRSSGSYNDTIQNSLGCDSAITFILTVNAVDASVANFTTSIASNAFNATYQWVYCDSNYAFVPGATNQIFTPTTNGNYAVIVTENGCTDTSACETVLPVGISENVLGNLVFFPNPTNGITTIRFGNTSLNTTIRINSLDGRLIHEQQNINSNQVQVDLTNQLQGIYFVTIQHNDAVRVIKLVRN